jgi:hypothetical protein
LIESAIFRIDNGKHRHTAECESALKRRNLVGKWLWLAQVRVVRYLELLLPSEAVRVATFVSIIIWLSSSYVL